MNANSRIGLRFMAIPQGPVGNPILEHPKIQPAWEPSLPFPASDAAFSYVERCGEAGLGETDALPSLQDPF